MKKNSKCPKCDSKDIIRVNGSNRGYGAGNNIMTGLFSTINVNRYICTNCGYCEEWIDKEDISKIEKSKNPKG